MKHGQSITWTSRHGMKTTITVRDCDTKEQALRMAIESAKKFGWTEPKWWQWWRWDDITLRIPNGNAK